MELMQIKNKKENILQEIEKNFPSINQIVQKSIDEIDEKVYEEARQLLDICKNIELEIAVLKEEKVRINNVLQIVEEAKIKAPLVPLEDVMEGLTQEKLEDLKISNQEIEEFFKKEEYNKFYELNSMLKDIIQKYEEKLKKEQEENELKSKQNDENEKCQKIIDELVKRRPVKYCRMTDRTIATDVKYADESEIETVSEKEVLIPEMFMDLKELFEMPYIAKSSNEYRKDYEYVFSTREYTKYEECDLEGKQAIKEKELEVKKILEDSNQDYDKEGKCFIRVNIEASQNKALRREIEYGKIKVLEIPATPRQLAESGILYTDFDWRSLEQIRNEEIGGNSKKGKISRKDIAEADKQQQLTTTEVSGVRGLMKKLLDKIKGIGEK